MDEACKEAHTRGIELGTREAKLAAEKEALELDCKYLEEVYNAPPPHTPFISMHEGATCAGRPLKIPSFPSPHSLQAKLLRAQLQEERARCSQFQRNAAEARAAFAEAEASAEAAVVSEQRQVEAAQRELDNARYPIMHP